MDRSGIYHDKEHFVGHVLFSTGLSFISLIINNIDILVWPELTTYTRCFVYKTCTKLLTTEVRTHKSAKD